MTELISSPVFQAYIASTVVLGSSLLVLANATAITRTFASEVVNPEDRVFNKEGTVVFEGGNPRTARYQRAHRNALENIPLFLITGFLLALTSVPLGTAATLFAIFVVARVAHSFAYVYEIQPWRTASFAVGLLDQFAILGVLAYYTWAAA